MNSTTNTINPKTCVYGCNTRIYWNTSENAYFEVFSGNRHQCPNRRQQQNSNYNNKKTTPSSSQQTTSVNKPSYYSTTTNNKKSSWSTTANTTTTPKPKMSNSLELLQGSIADIQRKYEFLSDIVSAEANGKVHGSQSHIMQNNNISLIVYYEVPEGQRDEIKQKFNSFVENLVAYNNN